MMNRPISLIPIAFALLLIFNSCQPKNEEDHRREEYKTVPLTKITELNDQKLSESSGLIKVDGELWSHNDSGGQNYLYQLNPTDGTVQKSVRIINAINTDWESLTDDTEHIYIGDFGNNLGERQDLKIYKISKDSLRSSNLVEAEIIEFYYSDQTEYYGSYDHNFDCEAMVSVGDSLYLFSKNWKNRECSVLSLSKKPGKYAISRKSTFNTQGVITDATYQEDVNRLLLVGYNLKLSTNEFYPFVWDFKGVNQNNFFGGISTRYNFDVNRQVEAVTFENNQSYWITAENEMGGTATLYKLNLANANN